MKKIGGNHELEIGIVMATQNELGENEAVWFPLQTLKGYLDLSSGDSRYNSYNAKIQESSHFFICDYQELDPRIKSENSRVFDPKTQKFYDVLLIDNPMELNNHLEFYLKYTGGQ